MEDVRPSIAAPAHVAASTGAPASADADGLPASDVLAGAAALPADADGTGSDGPAGARPDGAAVDVDAPAGDDADLDIDEALLDTIEQDLADVERALAMIDDGTYGCCDVCGNALDDDQLSRAPASRFCRAHLPLALS